MRIRFVFIAHLLLPFCLSAEAADVEQLLAAMSLDEKLALLHGHKDPDITVGHDSAGYLPGVPRLGIPPVRMADGPAGIRTLLPATALPAPVALAAAFDRRLAYEYGRVIGVEGRQRNQDILLSPMVNIVRVPQAGRNFETFGEDPLLAAEIVASEIDGIQSAGMMATVKHFAANNQETERLTIDAQVDPRTLREIYLPAFEAAVKRGVAAVMCAYNKVNGAYACDNHALLNDILRDEWGFEGFVMTDWWANHSLTALKNGLNIEMPGYTHPEYIVNVEFEEPLRAALADGSLAESDVDAALRPLLTMMDRFGFLDGPRPELALRDGGAMGNVAMNGAVLLKNAADALPLAADDFADILVLGPTASWTLIGGGGSSRVLPLVRDSALEVLQQLSGRDELPFMPGFDPDGVPIPSSAMRLPGSEESGIQQRAPDGTLQRLEEAVRLGGNALRQAGSWNWEAELIAPETGNFELILQTDGPTARLYLDDQRVIFNDGGVLSDASLLPTRDGLRNSSVALELEAGRRYRLRMEAWRGDAQPNQVRLAWVTPTQREAYISTAAEAATDADTVVIFAHAEARETADRESLSLPGYQDRFIQEVANAAAGKVVVVLNTGAPVTMPWLDDVDAVLEMWYPGQRGGNATAMILSGRVNPAGKLPVTFPKSLADVPAAEAIRFPGVDGRQEYSEGLFVGYRWYDARGIEPLFPFGHGLSYTTFDYSNLRIRTEGDDVHVSFTLTNNGQRDGAEVPQVYLSHAGDTGIDMEVRKLAGFDKTYLRAGESDEMTITLPARRFAWWNEAGHAWEVLPGPKTIAVGSSSRDLRLSADFTYSPDTKTLPP